MSSNKMARRRGILASEAPHHVTLHIANTATGEYDVHRPLPYPFHLDADGNVLRQEFWRGEPVKLLGFQYSPDAQEIGLLAEDWLPTAASYHSSNVVGPTAVVGLWPVFLDADGSIWSHVYPVDGVTRAGESE